MIAESTPYGGINLNTSDTVYYNETDPWHRWFEKVLNLIESYDIDMWSYINCNWDAQPMWRNSGFGDTRLSSNPQVMEKWHEEIIHGNRSQKFLMANSLDACSKTARSFLLMDLGVPTFFLLLFTVVGVLFKVSVSFQRHSTMGNRSIHEIEPLIRNM